jgi:prevent-host-death family protein
MDVVGVRALKQNASAVVAEAAAGHVLVVTDRGRPVAQLIPLPTSRIDGLVASGKARHASRPFGDLSDPEPGTSLTEQLLRDREAERF